MENYDSEGMMGQNTGIMSDTMDQMEQNAQGDYERSFEPEAPSAPAYEPPQQPYAGEYDQYIEDQAEANLVPQQVAQQPLPFKDISAMASAIADSMVSDDGAIY